MLREGTSICIVDSNHRCQHDRALPWNSRGMDRRRRDVLDGRGGLRGELRAVDRDVEDNRGHVAGRVVTRRGSVVVIDFREREAAVAVGAYVDDRAHLGDEAAPVDAAAEPVAAGRIDAAREGEGRSLQATPAGAGDDFRQNRSAGGLKGIRHSFGSSIHCGIRAVNATCRVAVWQADCEWALTPWTLVEVASDAAK